MKHSIDLKICYVVIAILVILSLFTIIFPSKICTSKSFDIIDIKPFGEIKEDDVIIQEFISDGNYKKLGIYFADYDKILSRGILYIKLIDEEKNENLKKIKLTNLDGSTFSYFDFNLKKGVKYRIEVKVKDYDHPITFFTTKAKIYGSKLIYNDEIQKNNMALSFGYSQNSYFNIWYYVFGIFVLLCYIVLKKK